MRELMQAKQFYDSLAEAEREELCKAIAEDIFFLEEPLQEDILALLHKVDPLFSEKIREINSFTI